MSKPITDEGLRLIAELLKTTMPEGWGFTLLVFQTNTDVAEVKYISTAERESMKATLKTMLDKWNKLEEFGNPNMN